MRQDERSYEESRAAEEALKGVPALAAVEMAVLARELAKVLTPGQALALSRLLGVTRVVDPSCERSEEQPKMEDTLEELEASFRHVYEEHGTEGVLMAVVELLDRVLADEEGPFNESGRRTHLRVRLSEPEPSPYSRRLAYHLAKMEEPTLYALAARNVGRVTLKEAHRKGIPKGEPTGQPTDRRVEKIIEDVPKPRRFPRPIQTPTDPYYDVDDIVWREALGETKKAKVISRCWEHGNRSWSYFLECEDGNRIIALEHELRNWL